MGERALPIVPSLCPPAYVWAVSMWFAPAWFPPDPSCLACEGRGKVRDRHDYIRRAKRPKAAPDISVEAGSFEHARFVTESVTSYPGSAAGYVGGNDVELEGQRFDFAAGGWKIETAAPEVPHHPGEPVPKGPNPQGIVQPQRIEQTLDDLLWDEDVFDAYFDASKAKYLKKRPKRAQKRFLDIWTAKVEAENVNFDALSRVTELPMRTLYNRLKRGQSALVAPKNEERSDDVTTAQYEALDAKVELGFERIERLIVGSWMADKTDKKTDENEYIHDRRR